LCVSAGGYAFPVDPSLAATDTTVFWAPEADPGTVVIAQVAHLPPINARPLADLTTDHARSSADGRSIVYGEGPASIRLFLAPDASPDQPAVAVVPLGPDAQDRIEAVMRLWRAMNNRRVPADARMTTQQRHRLRRMLQAVDGHDEGASYREIAEAIFGPARIAEVPWKTSALRDVTIDLVKDGLSLIDGGYRALLHRRRRQ
jgi:hypothetical protein